MNLSTWLSRYRAPEGLVALADKHPGVDVASFLVSCPRLDWLSWLVNDQVRKGQIGLLDLQRLAAGAARSALVHVPETLLARRALDAVDDALGGRPVRRVACEANNALREWVLRDGAPSMASACAVVSIHGAVGAMMACCPSAAWHTVQNTLDMAFYAHTSGQHYDDSDACRDFGMFSVHLEAESELADMVCWAVGPSLCAGLRADLERDPRAALRALLRAEGPTP